MRTAQQSEIHTPVGRSAILPVPPGIDHNVLPEGLWDTGERRRGKFFDIVDFDQHQDAEQTRLLRIMRPEQVNHIPPGVDLTIREDGMVVISVWDLTPAERAKNR